MALQVVKSLYVAYVVYAAYSALYTPYTLYMLYAMYMLHKLYSVYAVYAAPWELLGAVGSSLGGPGELLGSSLGTYCETWLG